MASRVWVLRVASALALLLVVSLAAIGPSAVTAQTAGQVTHTAEGLEAIHTDVDAQDAPRLATEPQYTAATTGGMFSLGTLGGDSSYASDINNAGQVVGGSTDSEGFEHAFLWTATDGMDRVGVYTWIEWATDINEAGQVIGGVELFGALGAFFWSQSDGAMQLDMLGGDTTATALNESGHVVGYGYTDAGKLRAFYWTAADGMRDIGDLGGDNVEAYDINDAGQVVGVSDITLQGYHAFLWSEADGMIDLGTLGEETSVALAINNAGQVVGSCSTVPGPSRAFLWTEADGMIDLGTLGGSSSAIAINEAGQVIGNSNGRTFLWTEADGMVDLGKLNAHHSQATALNDSGAVVGDLYYMSPPGSESMYTTHAFLWTPEDGMMDLGVMEGDSYSRVAAINDRGQVVGVSAPDYFASSQGFIWVELNESTSLPSIFR